MSSLRERHSVWRISYQGETAKEYISALYSLVDSCDYKDLKSEMLRDRLVVGIRDKSLSERLQLDSGLTLEMVMKQIRQKEAVKEQYQQLGSGAKGDPIVVDDISGWRTGNSGRGYWGGENLKQR